MPAITTCNHRYYIATGMQDVHTIQGMQKPLYIKTHGRVSAAKEVMWHTSVLFTGTAKSPFSTPHISITTGPISMKFIYFMPSIYTTLHTKFEEIGLVVCEIYASENCPIFFTFFFFFAPI